MIFIWLIFKTFYTKPEYQVVLNFGG